MTGTAPVPSTRTWRPAPRSWSRMSDGSPSTTRCLCARTPIRVSASSPTRLVAASRARTPSSGSGGVMPAIGRSPAAVLRPASRRRRAIAPAPAVGVGAAAIGAAARLPSPSSSAPRPAAISARRVASRRAASPSQLASTQPVDRSPRAERVAPRDEPVERERGLDPADLGLVERPAEAVDRRIAVVGVDHDLRDEVVVVRRHDVTRRDRRVDADARSGRHDPAADTTRRRRERRVTDPPPRSAPRSHDPSAWRRDRAAATTAALSGRAARDEELLAHDVDAGDELGDAVLHLEPRVDLEEPERAVRVQEELARGRVAQPGGDAEPDRHRVQVPALVRGQAGCGRFLDELLVPPLERAVALAEGDDVAVPRRR